MATTYIQYLQLDAGYDPIFANGTSLTNLDAVAQSIQTRLSLFLAEWWENLDLGLPVFQSILGQLGSQQGLNAIALIVQQNIEGAPFVSSVVDVGVTFSAGQLGVQYRAVTSFGEVSNSVTTPGLSASLSS